VLSSSRGGPGNIRPRGDVVSVAPSLRICLLGDPELEPGGSRDFRSACFMAEGEEEMTIPRPQEWTKAEVHQLRMLAKRKVSADSIAKLLGRYAGSVRTKALELRLILSKKAKRK
jgi:hypothetical protein